MVGEVVLGLVTCLVILFLLEGEAPLEEWDYNITGKCSLFVHSYVLKVILGTLS